MLITEFFRKRGDWVQGTHVFMDMKYEICIKILYFRLKLIVYECFYLYFFYLIIVQIIIIYHDRDIESFNNVLDSFLMDFLLV